MTSIKIWLKSTNGWQRIWFLVSLLGVLYFCLLFPFQEYAKGNSYRYKTLWETEAEMDKSECYPYMNLPFNQLVEPGYPKVGEGCYHIYTYRKFAPDNKPFTKEEYQRNFESESRLRILGLCIEGFFISIVLSAFGYGLGALVSWVIKGFKKPDGN